MYCPCHIKCEALYDSVCTELKEHFMKIYASMNVCIENVVRFYCIIFIFKCIMYDLKFKCDSLNLNLDRKSTRLNSSHSGESRMPSSA